MSRRFRRKAMALSLLVLSFLLFRPAKTPQLVDEAGRHYPNSVATLDRVRIGGVRQELLIRGTDRNNPILLFLHGGPGQPQMPYIRQFESALEKHFVVVNWDQRGSGKSYSPTTSMASMTLNQFISDTHELTQYLLGRFHQKKLYLVGHSWGSILGVLTAQRYPNFFYAYVGLGQVAESTKADQAYYRSHPTYLGEAGSLGPRIVAGFRNILLSQEYNLSDAARAAIGVWFTRRSSISEQVNAVDLSKTVPQLHVPTYFFLGRTDSITPTEHAKAYFTELKAPLKRIVWFEESGHTPFVTEPAKFARAMVEIVMKETYPSRKNSHGA